VVNNKTPKTQFLFSSRLRELQVAKRPGVQLIPV